MKLIILLFSVNCISAFLESEDFKKRGPGFIFTYPKTFLAGRNETVCLSLHKAEVPTKVLVDLKIKLKHYTTPHVVESEHTCFNLSIPKIRHNSKETQSSSIHVQVELNGAVHTAHSQDSVLIYPNHEVIFIETDRGLYSPGDRVRIRILVLTQEIKAPEKYIIPVIKIQNPVDATVSVWENVATELGFVQLEHQLSQDSMRGKWKIELREASKSFQVKEHILPRFKVTLNYPKHIYGGTDSVELTACALYSYGKNVKGTTLLKLSFMNYGREPYTEIKELVNGCTDFAVSSEALHLHEQVNSDLHLAATVTEHGTSRAETTTVTVHVTNKAYELVFDAENSHFQPGFPYQGKLRAISSLVNLLNEVVEICYNVALEKVWNIKNITECSNFTFGSSDTISFYVLPMQANVVQLHLQARALKQTVKEEWIGGVYPTRYNDEINAYFTVNRWYSASNNYIQIEQNNKIISQCKSVQHFTIYYTVNAFMDQNITFFYMLKSHGKMLQLRNITHNPRKQYTVHYNELKNVVGKNYTFNKLDTMVDTFHLKLKMNHFLISKLELLVYYVHSSGEVVAALRDIESERCLLNTVEAKWSHTQNYPGNRVTLSLKTDPNSLCSLSAVDKAGTYSVNSNLLNPQSLLKPFLQERAPKYVSRVNCKAHHGKKHLLVSSTEQSVWDLKRRKRSYGNLSPEFDSYEIFNKFGVSVITNYKLIAKPCGTDGGRTMIPNSVQYMTKPYNLRYDVQNEDNWVSVRSYFPETWLWELVPTGDTGELKLKRDLPHTITTWLTNLMCVSPINSVGLHEQVQITAFQPFFIDILTPYSIKRNEILNLHVTLFNYLNYSIPIRVSLGDSEGLELASYPDDRSTIRCIPGGDTSTVVFRIKGSKLGKLNITVMAEIESSYPGECGPEVILNKRDIVFKTVRVEPQGYQVDTSKSMILCDDDSFNSSVTFNLELPKNVIEDSVQAKVEINAELMGPTVQHLEKLLALPTGCGEQILATLAPNLYILRYFNATGKLTAAVRHRAVRNLKIGYQRILDYVHHDGSFSAFGYHDASGSMFLTAFVIRTLQQARDYIYVDQNVIERAVQWVIDHQLENGCFSAVSHVFHDLGGTSSENSTAALTSYVLISLLESSIDLPEKIRANAKYCIRGHHSPDKYTLAIGTYALFLVGWQSEGVRSLRQLLEVATSEGSLMWWSTPGPATTNIEMTAYVLMSLLHQNSSENLVHASSVVHWLATQRSSQGGFINTQDTVVALDAISRYASAVRDKEPDLQVTIVSKNQRQEVNINGKDRLKTKQFLIKNVPSTVEIATNGKGCILAQAFLVYNLNYIASSEAFKLAVDVAPVSTIDQCSVAVVSPCISYTGPGLHSNMAILEVTMPSGYEPDRASLYKLVDEANTKVKRFEDQKNQVILYFTELNNEPICVPFNINENSVVETRVDAIIKLYDYYNPELQVIKFYKVNTCLPNEIAPIPPLPGRSLNSTVKGNITDLSNDFILTDNMTVTVIHNIIVDPTEPSAVFKREAAENYVLNKEFIDMDVEMAMPEGWEGNVPVYVKLDASIGNIQSNELNTTDKCR